MPFFSCGMGKVLRSALFGDVLYKQFGPFLKVQRGRLEEPRRTCMHDRLPKVPHSKKVKTEARHLSAFGEGA